MSTVGGSTCLGSFIAGETSNGDDESFCGDSVSVISDAMRNQVQTAVAEQVKIALDAAGLAGNTLNNPLNAQLREMTEKTARQMASPHSGDLSPPGNSTPIRDKKNK